MVSSSGQGAQSKEGVQNVKGFKLKVATNPVTFSDHLFATSLHAKLDMPDPTRGLARNVSAAVRSYIHENGVDGSGRNIVDVFTKVKCSAHAREKKLVEDALDMVGDYAGYLKDSGSYWKAGEGTSIMETVPGIFVNIFFWAKFITSMFKIGYFEHAETDENILRSITGLIVDGQLQRERAEAALSQFDTRNMSDEDIAEQLSKFMAQEAEAFHKKGVDYHGLRAAPRWLAGDTSAKGLLELNKLADCWDWGHDSEIPMMLYKCRACATPWVSRRMAYKWSVALLPMYHKNRREKIQMILAVLSGAIAVSLLIFKMLYIASSAYNLVMLAAVTFLMLGSIALQIYSWHIKREYYRKSAEALVSGSVNNPMTREVYRLLMTCRDMTPVRARQIMKRVFNGNGGAGRDGYNEIFGLVGKALCAAPPGLKDLDIASEQKNFLAQCYEGCDERARAKLRSAWGSKIRLYQYKRTLTFLNCVSAIISKTAGFIAVIALVNSFASVALVDVLFTGIIALVGATMAVLGAVHELRYLQKECEDYFKGAGCYYFAKFLERYALLNLTPQEISKATGVKQEVCDEFIRQLSWESVSELLNEDIDRELYRKAFTILSNVNRFGVAKLFLSYNSVGARTADRCNQRDNFVISVTNSLLLLAGGPVFMLVSKSMTFSAGFTGIFTVAFLSFIVAATICAVLWYIYQYKKEQVSVGTRQSFCLYARLSAYFDKNQDAWRLLSDEDRNFLANELAPKLSHEVTLKFLFENYSIFHDKKVQDAISEKIRCMPPHYRIKVLLRILENVDRKDGVASKQLPLVVGFLFSLCTTVMSVMALIIGSSGTIELLALTLVGSVLVCLVSLAFLLLNIRENQLQIEEVFGFTDYQFRKGLIKYVNRGGLEIKGDNGETKVINDTNMEISEGEFNTFAQTLQRRNEECEAQNPIYGFTPVPPACDKVAADQKGSGWERKNGAEEEVVDNVDVLPESIPDNVVLSEVASASAQSREVLVSV